MQVKGEINLKSGAFAAGGDAFCSVKYNGCLGGHSCTVFDIIQFGQDNPLTVSETVNNIKRETPPNTPSKERRVAVLVTGQLRTHTHKINSMYWGSMGSLTGAPANMNQNLRVVDNQKNFFAQLGQPLDVFVYIQSRGTVVEPKIGDVTACDLFKDVKIPSRWRVFCKVDLEQCNGPEYKHALSRSEYSDGSRKGVLCPYLGYKGVAEMMVAEEKVLTVKYDWVVRLRADTIFLHAWNGALWDVVERSATRLWMGMQGCPFRRVTPCGGSCRVWPGGETTLTYCGMDIFNLGTQRVNGAVDEHDRCCKYQNYFRAP